MLVFFYFYQSLKDGDRIIHQEERFKWPEGTSPLWTHIAADSQGQIPWTYSGQVIDLEGIAAICDD